MASRGLDTTSKSTRQYKHAMEEDKRKNYQPSECTRNGDGEADCPDGICAQELGVTKAQAALLIQEKYGQGGNQQRHKRDLLRHLGNLPPPSNDAVPLILVGAYRADAVAMIEEDFEDKRSKEVAEMPEVMQTESMDEDTQDRLRHSMFLSHAMAVCEGFPEEQDQLWAVDPADKYRVGRWFET